MYGPVVRDVLFGFVDGLLRVGDYEYVIDKETLSIVSESH